jgi:hypothetical protein
MPTAVKASPANLGVNFNIEANDYTGGTSRVTIVAVGPHKFAGPGVRAVLARVNTYLGTTLSAANVDTLLANHAANVQINRTHCDFPCMTADVATLVTNLTSDLQAAGSVVAG